jgi:hypothetical protein
LVTHIHSKPNAALCSDHLQHCRLEGGSQLLVCWTILPARNSTVFTRMELQHELGQLLLPLLLPRGIHPRKIPKLQLE